MFFVLFVLFDAIMFTYDNARKPYKLVGQKLEPPSEDFNDDESSARPCAFEQPKGPPRADKEDFQLTTRLIAQTPIGSNDIYNGCLDPLDVKILHILVRHALAYPTSFFGLSSTNLLRAVHSQSLRGSSRRFTHEEVGAVRRALWTLEREGKIYAIKGSKLRYFPSSRMISAYGFAAGTQTKLERWV